MTELLRKLFGQKDKDEIKVVAEKQLEKNRATIESLRDYDTGKKDIPTGNVERRLRGIRTTS